MNNVILMGAILTFTSIIFGGTDSSEVDENAHLVMCKVTQLLHVFSTIIIDLRA